MSMSNLKCSPWHAANLKLALHSIDGPWESIYYIPRAHHLLHTELHYMAIEAVRESMKYVLFPHTIGIRQYDRLLSRCTQRWDSEVSRESSEHACYCTSTISVCLTRSPTDDIYQRLFARASLFSFIFFADKLLLFCNFWLPRDVVPLTGIDALTSLLAVIAMIVVLQKKVVLGSCSARGAQPQTVTSNWNGWSQRPSGSTFTNGLFDA